MIVPQVKKIRAKGGSAEELLDVALWRPSEGRGFDGVLTGVRTPLGLATITSHAERGLTIALERANSDDRQRVDTARAEGISTQVPVG